MGRVEPSIVNRVLEEWGRGGYFLNYPLNVFSYQNRILTSPKARLSKRILTVNGFNAPDLNSGDFDVNGSFNELESMVI